MLAYSKQLHVWCGVGPICSTTADHLAVQSQQNRCLEAVRFLHSANSLFAVRKWWELQQIRVSASGKGWYTVTSNRDNTESITETSLKPC